MARPCFRADRGPILRGAWRLLLFSALASGCSKPTGTTDPPVKVRLQKVFELYQDYTREKKKPPPNEEAFKDYLRALPPERREETGVGDDVDGFLKSPRDGQPYVIRYHQVFHAGGPTQAAAWEQTGKDGRRFVALASGYAEEYSDEAFNALKKE